LRTNYDSRLTVSDIQFDQFNALCNDSSLIKERFITAFIERLFVKPFFGSVREKSMKLLAPIMLELMETFQQITNEKNCEEQTVDREIKGMILLCVFAFKPFIYPWILSHHQHLPIIVGHEYKNYDELNWDNSFLGGIFLIYMLSFWHHVIK